MRQSRWYVAPAYRNRVDHEILNADGEQVALFQELADAERVVELWNKQWDETERKVPELKFYTLADLERLMYPDKTDEDDEEEQAPTANDLKNFGTITEGLFTNDNEVEV